MATPSKEVENVSAKVEIDFENEAITEGASGVSAQQNVIELKGNFEQQQAMIGQLRDMLKQKEATKKKEKVLEDYATRLAKMKPRLVGGRGRGRLKEKDEYSPKQSIQQSPNLEFSLEELVKGTISSTYSEPKMLPVAIDIIPDARMDTPKDAEVKDTNKESISESAQSATPLQESGSRSKILLLRKQLEENRLKFERQQRENAEKRAAMEDMKERIERLRDEVEKRDTLIQSLQEVDSYHHSNPNVQHLYQQIMHKDNKVLELSDKIDHLESIIKDQEEQLNEKDQVISARTEAVSLITKDRDDKIMKTVQELEELRDAMKHMQETFTLKEEKWKEKEHSLENRIIEKDKKISILEENNRRIENIRFELSTRNAELQEKIISLQCDSKKLKEKLAEAAATYQEKSLELDEVKKKLVRAEAFGQKKLKALEKQVKSISEEGGLGNKILELQNQIAELEEEKGNLQLKLVDFDEVKMKCDKLNDSLRLSRGKIDQLDAEILSQLTTISHLENEKISLVEQLNSRDLKINSVEKTAKTYKSQCEDAKQSKVILELRLCEVEEERDLALKNKKDLENEMKKMAVASPSDRERSKSIFQQEIHLLKVQLEDKDSKIRNLEDENAAKEALFRKTEEEKEDKMYENQCLIGFLAEKESLITSQSIKIEKHDSVIESLNKELSSKESYIQNIMSQSESLRFEIESLNSKLSESENIISELNITISNLRTESENNSNSILQLKESEQFLKTVIDEKNNLLQVLESEIETLKTELSKREMDITNHLHRLENFDSILQAREKQILNLESEIADKVKENSQQVDKCKTLDNEINNLKASQQKAMSHLIAECDAISSLLSDKDNCIKALEEQISIKNSQLKNSELLASGFEKEACEKNLLYDQLLEEKNFLASNVLKLKAEIAELMLSNLDIILLQESLQEREASIEQLKQELSCLLSDKDNCIKALEEQISIKNSQLKNSELLSSGFEKEACEKNLLYDQLLEEKNFLASNVLKLKAEIAELILSKVDIILLQESLQEREASIKQLKQELVANMDKFAEQEELICKLEIEKGNKDEDISDIRSSLEGKENQFQQLQSEFQTYASSKDNENSQLLQIINEKDSEINCLKESLSSSGQVAENLNNSLRQVENLEQEVLAKNQELQQLQEQLHTKHESLIQIEIDLKSAKNEVQIFKDQLEELNQTVNELRLQKTYSNSELESRNTILTDMEKEIHSLKTEIEEQKSYMQQSQGAFNMSSDYAEEYETLKTINTQLKGELQGKLRELDEKSTQLTQYNTIYEAALNEERTKLKQMEGEFSLCKIHLDEKNNEILSLKITNQDLSSKIDYFINLSHTQSLESQENESELNRLHKLESDCLSYQEEIKMLKQKLEEENLSHSNLAAQYDSLAQQLLEKEKEIRNLEECQKLRGDDINEATKLASSEIQNAKMETVKALEDENNSLKKQLEEAQQAIIRLETSLATQSTNLDNSQEGSESWGTVDLGEPAFTAPSQHFMQSSLMEKDKTLTVIQEQLKSALEDVNTANDEKKILQHQMKTLEAELSHKDQKIVKLEAHVQELNNTVMQLSKTATEFSSNVGVSTEQVQALTSQEFPEEQSIEAAAAFKQPPVSISSNEAQQLPESTSATALWFKPSSTSSSGNFWGNIETIPQQTQVQDTECEDSISVTPEIQDESKKPSPECPTDKSVQELQYKLSWYEENWVTWTEHYAQLQESYKTAEQHIAYLTQELETLKSSQELTNVDDTSVAQISEFSQIINTFKEEKSKLEDCIQKAKEEESAFVNELNMQHHTQIENANHEISRLKGYETQVYELQGQLQTLQHQCSVLESKASDAETNSAKVREYETLYGELQTCMQEAETKREGSKSRVQELELMVQSAESEIARLRSDLQKLTGAGEALEGERNVLQEEIQNLKEEIRKSVSERERFERENDRLQNEAATLHSQSVDLIELNQRNRTEIDQLKSEIEVLEGDNERTQSNYEIMEVEVNRLRSEKEVLSHINQITQAEKESLETETQRLEEARSSLTIERDHIRGEMQRLTEVATSAESEISRLQIEVQNMTALNTKCKDLERKHADLQERFKAYEKEQDRRSTTVEAQDFQLEEVDWGSEAKIEDEHLQRSSSVERSLQEELLQLKEKIISLEKERNEISDELQAAKLKNGKMIQKLKAANNKNENLQKEIKKLSKKAGGFSDLDLALEEEWSAQVAKAEAERDELKIKLDEAEKEKDHMKNSLDIFESAQDKYFEMKESQDAHIRQLSAKNKNLESQIASLEWKISELEENSEERAASSFTAKEDPEYAAYLQVSELKSEMSLLLKEIEELKEENEELKKVNLELSPKLEELSNENDILKSVLEDMRDAKRKSEMDINTYKTSFLELHTEHDTLLENFADLTKNLEAVKSEHFSLKAAYDVLYEEYHQLQHNRDSVRLELGIITGERDKLQEEVNSLNNQLLALQEEEEEEIIRALQGECSDLRDQNSELKDEITRMNESMRQMEESVERTKHSLDQQVDIQDLLRQEMMNKSLENEENHSTISQLEKQIKYMIAENASIKTKCSQMQSAFEKTEPQVEELKTALAEEKEKNSQLIKQIKITDVSLVTLATRQTTEKPEEKFSSLEATELEAALSSLHLRDLRCQQFSLEINKLLEERDGLQLKLSAALRQVQDLTRELSLSQRLPAPQTTPTTLSQKLAELRDLNSSLEQKALDSLRVGSMSTLPPSLPTFVSHTAPATPTATRHLDYTITRENQGASSVIMNWFLGKSPPKEVLHV